MANGRYVCIHCHFYQPPRENPWLEAIELQDSAYPFHDWNERIATECYAPNAASRILDAEGRIEKIVNNYARMSFNFGPTLLSWLGEKDRATYEAVLEADRESRRAFSGHGAALAQAYNHVIMPLANGRDKQTQVVWGLRDFEHRFGRRAEGLWLPETAVDLETLEILARRGIRFTILAPRQARRVRRKGSRQWQNVGDGQIDPSMGYELRLPSGRRIGLFFYDGPISRAIAFEGLLNSGDALAGRILDGFSGERATPHQLVHIATDGETYGHHHAHGEMALSYALNRIASRGDARITVYGEFLERHPPTHEVEIHENSSWSCIHGIERWRRNCGCNSGGRPEWNQEWRAPLRESLDWLRDALAPAFEAEARRLLKNPWAARDAYIDVILDRSPESVARFLGDHAAGRLSPEKASAALKLLELQRHAMLMYTSCGWFFDELSGIETVQILQYAGRAIQLGQDLFGDGIESRFLDLLSRAASNVPEHRDGRRVYEGFVKPAFVDLHKVGAHYAVSSLFENYGDRAEVFCYGVDREEYRVLPAGKARLALGRATITSTITGEAARVSFGVLHLGDHNVSGGIREFQGDEAYGALVREITDVFKGADLPEIFRAVERNFGAGTYSLKLLFRDEQRKILNMILERTLSDAESAYRQLYGEHAPLMRFLSDMGFPLPRPFRAAAELALNAALRAAFEADELDLDRVKGHLEEAEAIGVPLDGTGLGYSLQKTIERLAENLRSRPADLPRLRRLEAGVDLGRTLPFEVAFWKTQKVFYELLQSAFPEALRRARGGDPDASAWAERFAALGDKLFVRVRTE
ncbi:MAG: DUF3536 domain-containing protein [Gemmatimonadota bacterium]